MFTIMKRSSARLAVFLKETLIIKNLSPERAAPFIGCTGRQIRRWIEGEVTPSPVHMKAIEAGISKINRGIPGDTPDGLVSWRGVEISKEAIAVDKKTSTFYAELLAKAGPGGRSVVLETLDDNDNFLGFEEIIRLAVKLKVKLPEI